MKDGGIVASDNCNTENKFSHNIEKRIGKICIQEVEKKGGDPVSILVM